MASVDADNSLLEIGKKILDKLDKFIKPQSHKSIKKLSDFWWDTICIAVITLLLGFTSVNAVTVYFRDLNLSCLIGGNLSTPTSAFVSEVCKHQLPALIIYNNLFLFCEIICLSATQQFWKLIPLDYETSQFINVINRLTFEKNKDTGFADADDILKVRHLQSLTSSRQHMGVYVTFKVVLQLIISLLGFIYSVYGIIYTLRSNGSFFICDSSKFPEETYLFLASSETLYCAYSEPNNIQSLLQVNVIATIVIVFANLCSIVSIHVNRVLLDYKKIVEFQLTTGLSDGALYYSRPCWQQYFSCCKRCKKRNKKGNQCNQCKVPWDIVFLLMQLYSTNTKKADGLFGILIDSYKDYIERFFPLGEKEINPNFTIASEIAGKICDSKY